MPNAALPPPLNTDAVRLFWEDMPSGIIAEDMRGDASAIAGASPYLRTLMLRDPVFAGRVFREDAGTLLTEVLEALPVRDDMSQAEMMTALRKAKSRAALLIAVADVLGRWSVMEVTAKLTRLADRFLQTAT